VSDGVDTGAERSHPATRHVHRPTGASLAIIILVSAGFLAVIALHALRTDLDPIREVMSGYANGSHGVVMTAAFYALGVASVVMAYRLPKATHRSFATAVVTTFLVVAGLGLIMAGVFEVERPLVPDTIEEAIHSNAAILAFVLLVMAMLLFSVPCVRDPRWRPFAPISMSLAVVATIGAAISPLANGSAWSGLAQRGLGLAVFAWLLAVAIRIRFGRLEQHIEVSG
jgi:hypothetical membrane protein